MGEIEFQLSTRVSNPERLDRRTPFHVPGYSRFLIWQLVIQCNDNEAVEGVLWARRGRF